MIDYDTFIKYWKLPELQNLKIVEAVERMLEMEAKNGI